MCIPSDRRSIFVVMKIKLTDIDSLWYYIILESISLAGWIDMIVKQNERWDWAGSLVTILLICVVAGCQTGGQSGALVGGGVGALIGQAAGSSTEATLIGAAVGTGVGYIIGNQKDKEEAERRTANVEYSSADSPLAGTSWQVVSVVPEPDPPFKSMTVHFGRDGYVETNKILTDGQLIKASEHFRTVGKTLIVNKPGYMINATYAIDGDQLIVDCEKFRGVLTRVGS
jgi:outer membrane protein with glycine zipper